MTESEREIASDTLHLLRPWIESLEARMSESEIKAHRKAFQGFMDWCAFYQVPTPCSGIVAARYLLDLLAYGRQLDELKAAAAAIKYFYRQRRAYLDEEPIAAAIELAEAQLNPGRILN
jgi:hypothetical protein